MTQKRIVEAFNPIYFVTDIEADGPSTRYNSMLSFASVVLDKTGDDVASYAVNLQPAQGRTRHDKTMQDFWAKFPKAWAAVNHMPLLPEDVMPSYKAWIERLCASYDNATPIFISKPVGYDYKFMDAYFQEFLGVGMNPFRHNRHGDVMSYLDGLLDLPHGTLGHYGLPEAFRNNLPHTHIALDDARKEAAEWATILRYAAQRRAENMQLHINRLRNVGANPSIYEGIASKEGVHGR